MGVWRCILLAWATSPRRPCLQSSSFTPPAGTKATISPYSDIFRRFQRNAVTHHGTRQHTDRRSGAASGRLCAARRTAGIAKAIEIKNLVKQYKKVTAVNNISLDVYEGEIFGFLGPNGAGKTTTIKTLLGLIFPTAGEVLVLGKPAGDIDVKEKISYLPESPYFYEHMTANEVVGFYGSLFGLTGTTRQKRVDYLLELVGLQGTGKKPLRAFSKGMLQRVGIAQSLINDPKAALF